MMRYVEEFADMYEKALLMPLPQKAAFVGKGLVVVGMGGSAIAGDILRDCIEGVKVDVWRGYGLPSWLKEEPVIFVSYSGNTEETLSAFSAFVGTNAVAITSGGRLAELARARGIAVINVPGGLPPRASLPYLLFPALRMAERCGARVDGVEEAVKVLRESGDSESVKESVKGMAEALQGQVAIYCPPGFEGAARRMKTQLNENAKMHARWEAFPELHHNEIVGWENTKAPYSVIFIRDAKEHNRIRARIEFTKKLLQGKANIFEMWSRGESKIARVLSIVSQGDLLSVYLAQRRGVDPLPVKTIDLLKEHLAKV